MLIKMCPLCDSEMTKSHYCDTCHSFIWKPDIIDVHLDAQERGLGEIDCAYGDAHDAADHKHSVKKEKEFKAKDVYKDAVKKTETKKKTQTSAQKTTTKSAASDHEQVFGNAKKQKKKKKGGCLTWFIIILVIWWFAADFFASLGKAIINLSPEDIQNMPFVKDILEEFSDSSSDDETTSAAEAELDLSDEELAEKYPDGCNTFGHMSVTYEDIEENLQSWMSSLHDDASLDITEDEQNYLTAEDNAVLSKYDYIGYNSDNNTYPLFIGCDSDSVTGQIHYLNMTNADEKEALSALMNIVPLLDTDTDLAQEMNDEAEGIISEAKETGESVTLCGDSGYLELDVLYQSEEFDIYIQAYE